MDITAKIFQEGEEFDGRFIETGAIHWPERVPVTMQGIDHAVIGYAENFHRTEDGAIMANITVTTDDTVDPDKVVSWVNNIVGFNDADKLHISFANLRELKALK